MKTKTTTEIVRRRVASLKVGLGANALFSSVTGVLLVLRGENVGALLGFGPAWLWTALGAGLLYFALELVYQVSRSKVEPWRVLVILVMDFGWVLGSTVVLWAFPSWYTPMGGLWIAGVAAVVGLLMAVQGRGLLGLFRSESEEGYRVCLRLSVNRDAESMWKRVGDLGGISRYAPMLATSRLTEPGEGGVGAVRTCADMAGRTWSERCTAYREGKGYDVCFLANASDFPFPFSAMRGGWALEPRGDSCEVEVWWELTPRPRLLALVILPLYALAVERAFPPVVEAMAEDEPVGKGKQAFAKRVRLLPVFC